MSRPRRRASRPGANSCVSTYSDQVDGLVRDQQGVDSAKDLDLEQVPTWALIEEVYKRVGVQCIDVGVEERYTLRTAVWKTRKTIKEVKNRGPAKILIVTD